MADHQDGSKDRRGVIRNGGLVLLALQLLPSIGRASQGPSGAGLDPSDALVIRSGPGFVPHTHDLWIPYAVLKAPPPAGVTLTSTMARGHTHEVTLSHDDLASVNRGGTVSVKGGSHTFVIARAAAVADPTPASQAGGSNA